MFVMAGATGRVGGVAARALLDQDEDVRVVVRDATRAGQWRAYGADVAVGSLADAAFLADALADAAGFFTLLPLDYTATDPYDDQRRLADAVTSAVERSDVPHVVLLSSHGAELAEGTGLVKCLHYLEGTLAGTRAQLTTIRSGYHQDNIATALGPAQAQGIVPTFLPADTAIRMVATRDVGRLAARCLAAPAQDSEAIDIQGPRYSMREVAAKLATALGRPLQVVEIPQAGWTDALIQAGMPARIAEAFAEMYAALVAGRFVPAGDRLVEAATPLDTVLATLLAQSRTSAEVVPQATSRQLLPDRPRRERPSHGHGSI